MDNYNFIRTETVQRPIEPLLTLDEVKAHLRVDSDYEDDYITSLVSVATDEAEEVTRRRFGDQIVNAYFEHWQPVTLYKCGVVQDIELYSLCEHHLLPFIGRCHVAYLPKGKVLGLSKVARIVDMYARRLQIQEQLTLQIAESIMAVTEAAGVGVIIEAEHMCMMMRGVEKQNSATKTSAMLGAFRDDARTRDEFLSLLQLQRSR